MNEEIYESINREHTLYCIYLQLTEDQTVKVGKLGDYLFQKEHISM